MTYHAAAAMMLIAAMMTVDASPDIPADGVEPAQIVRGRIIVRVPRLPRAPEPAVSTPPPPTEWRERKGPKCITAARLRGAIVTGDDQVDLVLAGNERVRAKLKGDCPALGFYGGFYLKPAGDGDVCAGRDVVRSRSGGLCEIARFRRLQAKR
ncbi:hypothetical protein [uncultured Sphingomonas sp.]|uniref:hypothetical protein n=1 Tax=uncultured Sphingomonas sp. TaxID=158754 RepID=UPI0035CB0F6B